jgi:hypothetical protein
MNNFKVVEFRNMKNYMSKFVSQNTFIKYIFQFLINIFIKIRNQSYVLETVSLA